MKNYNTFLYLLVITLICKWSDGFSANDSLSDFVIEEKANEYISVDDIKKVKNATFSNFTQITDQVFQTSIGAINGTNLIKYNIRCIFDLTFELNYTLPNGTGIEHFEYKTLKDLENDKIAPLFDVIANQMQSCVKQGKNIVVHCFAGASRAGAVVTAYLIKHGNMSLKKAFIHIKSLRPIYRPNNGFMEQLIDYEKKTRGNASVKMVTLERDGLRIKVPDFFESKYPEIVDADFEKARKLKTVNEMNEETQLGIHIIMNKL